MIRISEDGIPLRFWHGACGEGSRRLKPAARFRATGDIVTHLGVTLLLAVAGCSRPHRTWIPPINHQDLGPTVFLHYLSTVPWASVDEASRAVLILVDGQERLDDFDARLAELAKRGAIDPNWIDGPDQLLDLGTLAYMLRHLCRIPPSTNEWMLGSLGVGRRRYALTTCIDAAILPYGASHDLVSGGELLGAITRADGYIERRDHPEAEAAMEGP